MELTVSKIILFSIMWIVFAIAVIKLRSRKIIVSAKVENQSVDNIITVKNKIIINLITDEKEIDPELFGEWAVKLTDLISGNYQVPERFKPGYDPVTGHVEKKDENPPVQDDSNFSSLDGLKNN